MQKKNFSAFSTSVSCKRNLNFQFMKESNIFNESNLVWIICSWTELIQFSSSTHWLSDPVATINSLLEGKIMSKKRLKFQSVPQT